MMGIESHDREHVSRELNSQGNAVLEHLLSGDDCRHLVGLYPDEHRFRSRIVMARHGLGQGEYQYFRYPLPDLVESLRTTLCAYLEPIANQWHDAMNLADRYPTTLPEFLQRCHEAGQERPTPLLLRYGVGHYNWLHQDLCGDEVFPLQVAVLPSEPGSAFTGGEFMMTEQRPRMQSRVEVVPLRQRDAVVFAVHHRPMAGTRGHYRVRLRHGVSRIRSEPRYTLGIILHDAR